MTAARMLAELRAGLARRADPGFARTAQSFSKEPLRSQGVPSADLRRMAGEAYREVKQWPPARRNTLCTELLKSGLNEEGVLAIYLYQRFQKQCAACEFRLFARWVERYVDNWGWCDGIAHYLLSAAIANQPELARLLPPWTASRNRWKRRAAAVALVHEARRGRCTGLILEVARRMLPDTDDLVRKAVGWLLKEAYVARPREVMAFLRSEGKNVPRLVVRIIGEKMTVEDRLQVK